VLNHVSAERYRRRRYRFKRQRSGKHTCVARGCLAVAKLHGALKELRRRDNCGGSKKEELHAAVLGQYCTLTYRPQTVL
jgi:hypothetical protein